TNAECGSRNAEHYGEGRSANDLSRLFRVPRFHFRVRGGGAGMKYFVTIGAQTHEVEVDGKRVTEDGVGLETDVAPVSGTPLYHLLLGGASWTIAAEPLEGAGRRTVGQVGERVEVAVQVDRSRGVGRAAGKVSQPSGGRRV